jgi:hypothetical protein
MVKTSEASRKWMEQSMENAWVDDAQLAHVMLTKDK